ncbi:30S ribosomal protein S12-like [Tropilaelaps mercedesae]|uniref:Small ribosomal subunit protein uS12m n=1 Tax=Tropilaelaps mercedesae TaxID=418985 RepID=A0A1V9X5R4_9ACAR|nr:30S ribosomal protein S12-like [Tropilaelaps mercedesae]
MLRSLMSRIVGTAARLSRPILDVIPKPIIPQLPQIPLVQQVRHRYFVKFHCQLDRGLIHDRVLEKVNMGGIPKPKRLKPRCPIDNKPFMKGVVIKTIIKKPKKPNSANRKCVLVRLSNGKEATAFVPGVGHNLQEHSIVLVYKARTKDVPGLKLKVVRGKYDCAHVIRKPQS